MLTDERSCWKRGGAGGAEMALKSSGCNPVFLCRYQARQIQPSPASRSEVGGRQGQAAAGIPSLHSLPEPPQLRDRGKGWPGLRGTSTPPRAG